MWATSAPQTLPTARAPSAPKGANPPKFHASLHPLHSPHHFHTPPYPAGRTTPPLPTGHITPLSLTGDVHEDGNEARCEQEQADPEVDAVRGPLHDGARRAACTGRTGRRGRRRRRG